MYTRENLLELFARGSVAPKTLKQTRACRHESQIPLAFSAETEEERVRAFVCSRSYVTVCVTVRTA